MSVYFVRPSIIAFKKGSETLEEINASVEEKVDGINIQLANLQSRIDDIVWNLYGVQEGDRKILEGSVKSKYQTVEEMSAET